VCRSPDLAFITGLCGRSETGRHEPITHLHQSQRALFDARADWSLIWFCLSDSDEFRRIGRFADPSEGVNNLRDKPAGTLRINSNGSAARQILVSVVLEPLRRYPDMKVEIVTEGRLIDIVADGFGAGIRPRGVVPGDRIAVPFGADLRFAVVGSPAYFEKNPPPRTPGDLMRHHCIRARLPSGAMYRWEFAQRSETLTIDVPGVLTLDEPTLAREAALAGAGLAYMREAWIAQDVAAGRLVSVLTEWMPSAPGLCLYYPGRRNVPASLRAFIDVIREIEPPADDRSPERPEVMASAPNEPRS
jgi:DNA-binding transcriptional LysR family regulator